jgi:hypothetical protein
MVSDPIPIHSYILTDGKDPNISGRGSVSVQNVFIIYPQSPRSKNTHKLWAFMHRLGERQNNIDADWLGYSQVTNWVLAIGFHVSKNRKVINIACMADRSAGSLGFNDDNRSRDSSQENTPPKIRELNGLKTHETEKTRTLNTSLHPNHPATERKRELF